MASCSSTSPITSPIPSSAQTVAAAPPPAEMGHAEQEQEAEHVVVRFVVTDDHDAVSRDDVMHVLSNGRASSGSSLVQRVLRQMPADDLHALLRAMREGTWSVAGSAAMDTQPPQPPATPKKLVVTDPDKSQCITIPGTGEVCTICQECIEPDSVKSRATPLVQTACGHTFCKSCLQQWFDAGHNTCCVCNATVASVVQINNPTVTSSTTPTPTPTTSRRCGQKRNITQTCSTSCSAATSETTRRCRRRRQMTQPSQSDQMSAAEGE